MNATTIADAERRVREAAAARRPLKARRSWFRRHPKLTMTLALLLAVALGAGIALALLMTSAPVSGSYQGQAPKAAIQLVSVTDVPSNDPACAWSTDGTKVSLAANPVSADSTTPTSCAQRVTVKNVGDVDVYVQDFNMAATTGSATVTSGTPDTICGTLIPVGGTGDHYPVAKISAPIGDSGSLAGELIFTDTYDTNACTRA